MVYIPCNKDTIKKTKADYLPWLCKLGLHKWKNYGNTVMIYWQEKGFVFGFETHSKLVYEKRKCLRCGVGGKHPAWQS